ncbi:MAG: PVC-type heme-binding CxxCH protein, partial [Planctomycetota bacterium]
MLPPTFILLALALQAESPFQPPEFRTPDGIGIQLWAEAPLIHNPTAIDIDERGRVWCTEGVRYRRWGGRNPGLERAGDRVVIVSDEDGDGRADRSHVFVEDPDLVAPLGLLVLDGVVLVSSSPHLFAYFDDDGDDVSDRRETLLTGFGGFDHDHGLHSAVLGPDGALYLAVGNAGPHLVTDAAGWSLASGSIYTGGGPVVADNKPGLVSDDGRAWTGGLMLRVERDGSGLRVLAHNFRNPYELAVDPFGRMWTADNDDDGNRGCRATWVLPAGDHGYFSADGSRYWQADRRPGQTTSHAHWHADDPGVAPSGTIYGAGSPTGVTYIGDGPLAERLGETLVTADAGRGIVFAWRIEADGSGWRLDERRLVEPVRESPGADRFRPSDVTLAPDGSLFIADWYDPAVGGHYAGDRASRGNLYRVASKRGHAAAPPSAMKSVVRAVGALGASSARVRQRARARLARIYPPALLHASV